MIKNVIFDLDGTITDPKVGIVNSILFAVEQLNLIEHHPKELAKFIGPNLYESFQRRYHLSSADTENAVRQFRVNYSAEGSIQCDIYPGMTELLQSLTERSVKIFVGTSKPTCYAKPILEHFDLAKYFIEISGTELGHKGSDKLSLINNLLIKHHLNPDDSVMIGDRKYDIDAGNKLGLTTIAVSYGFGSIEELSDMHPNYICSNCDEIRSILLQK